MKNGIEPKLISSLDELGVAPSRFTNYGIVSKATAETTETAIKAYGTDAVVDVITKYNKNAFTALDNGLSPTLINSLDNLGVSPSKFTDYGIISKETAEVTETLVTTYGDDVITALDNGIEPTLIKSLDDLQITPAEFTKYKITSKTAAEATENAINQGSVKTWKAFFEDNVGKYGFESAKEASDDYLELLTGTSPWPKNGVISEETLTVGTQFEMAIDSSWQIPDNGDPIFGQFGTFDNITDVNFVRNQLAVRTDWKSTVDKVLIVEVTQELTVKTGYVGPQIDLLTDCYLPGGATQIMLPDGINRNEYLLIFDIKDIY